MRLLLETLIPPYLTLNSKAQYQGKKLGGYGKVYPATNDVPDAGWMSVPYNLLL